MRGRTYYFGTPFWVPYGLHFYLRKSVIPSHVSSTLIISFSLCHCLRNSMANCYLSMIFFGELAWILVAVIRRNRMPIWFLITALISYGFASKLCSICIWFLTYSTESITSCLSLSYWTISWIFCFLWSILSLSLISSLINFGFLVAVVVKVWTANIPTLWALATSFIWIWSINTWWMISIFSDTSSFLLFPDLLCRSYPRY